MLFSPGKEDVAIDWFQPMQARTSAQLPVTVSNPVPDGLAPCHAAENTVADEQQHDVCPNDETAAAQNEDEQLISDIKKFADDTISKFLSNRELFRKPLLCFIRNSKKIVNDSHLVSAMHTYGKYNGAATATRRLGCKARLQVSAQIGVQPLAVIRRKVPLGGRRRLRAGRPSKSTFTTDHSYVSSKKRRRVAPHNLGHCVEANISLGKTHSAM